MGLTKTVHNMAISGRLERKRKRIQSFGTRPSLSRIQRPDYTCGFARLAQPTSYLAG